MSRQETFYWYDLETFGLNSSYDRIAQFAGVRTNADLEVIEEPLVLYCRLSDDYLPNPLAGMVTHITPQEVQKEGLNEAQFISQIHAQFSYPRTCVVGYNSIQFDDEFIRNALYRNFFDPYSREYKNNNSRWDIIDLARATRDFRPEGINWPVNAETGKPSFKLEELSKANTLSTLRSHDALNDVMTTIALGRLIKEKQGRLYHWALGLRKRNGVKKVVNVPLGQPFFHTSARYTTAEGCTRLVVPLTAQETNPDSIILFDLSYPIEPLLEYVENLDTAQRATYLINQAQNILPKLEAQVDPLSRESATLLAQSAKLLEQLADEEYSSRRSIFTVPGITRLALNRIPFVSPLNTLSPERSQELGIDLESALERYQILSQHPTIPAQVRIAADSLSFPQEEDVDGRLYSGLFFGDADQRKFATIRELDVDSLWEKSFRFDDNRAHTMLWRYLCRNWPENLAKRKEEQQRWISFCANRLLTPVHESQLSFEKFFTIIEGKLADTEVNSADKAVLVRYKEWGQALRQRLLSK